MRLTFGELTFDSDVRRLSRGGRPVHLEPKAFALLELLVERRPAAVAKSVIRDRLWPRTFVSESSLTRLVGQLRRALEADERFLRTVHGFGYAFDDEEPIVDPVSPAAPRAESSGAIASGPCLVWRERVFPLAEGESVLGRDPGVDVFVDVPGVSRRHARIVVRGEEATIEDLGSKNGTFVEDRRVPGPTPLGDRSHLRLGRTTLVFRRSRLPRSTATELP